jgi:hypothetical protein
MVVSHVVLVVNKNNNFGLAKDAELLKGAWIAWGRAHGLHGLKVSVLDPREPPVVCDVVVFLEVPHPVWFPWAKVRVLMLNEEWWLDAWNGYVKEFDLILCKTKDAAVRLAERTGTLPEQALVHWKGTVMPAEFNLTLGPLKAKEQSWSWFLGGSVNKIAAAKQLLPLWPVSNLPLKVYVTAEFLNAEELAALPENVKVIVGDLSPKQHRIAAAKSVGHVNCSAAESFGYAAAESVAAGAFMLLNRINTYSEYYGDCRQAAWVDLSGSAEEIQKALVEADARMRVVDLKTLSDAQAKFYEKMDRCWKESFGAFADAVAVKVSAAGDLGPRPPILPVDECPPVSVVILTHNRSNFVKNFFLQLMSSDYLWDKIEVVVVDDTPSEKNYGPMILGFRDRIAPMELNYIPLDKKHTIGEKRNIGVKFAKHNIIAFMDDDDSYPITSLRRRIAWLTKTGEKTKAVACTAIACYDLQTGVSFMNVPPYNLPLEERVSEATLTFYKSFWYMRPFPATDSAEGEGFLKGRADAVLELPPQQIIVAFTHGKNASARIVPQKGIKPSCAWGFSKEELIFYHGLAGVEIEEAGRK